MKMSGKADLLVGIVRLDFVVEELRCYLVVQSWRTSTGIVLRNVRHLEREEVRVYSGASDA